jgi:hypothetical protein
LTDAIALTELATGLGSFLATGALVLALGSPVFYIARRQQRRDTIRNFALGAAGVALACALLEVTSNRQVAQCIAAGNPDCIDAGAAGMRLLFIGGYIASAWIAAFTMYRR